MLSCYRVQALGTTLASTSLLIIVGTVLQAARQVRAHQPPARDQLLLLLLLHLWSTMCTHPPLACGHLLSRWQAGRASRAWRAGALWPQVEALLEGPKLQRALDQERAIIRSLSGL